MTYFDSGVQAYFGSQGPGYQAADPTGPTWAPPGFGPYTSGLPLPTLPGAPTPLVYPAPVGNPFLSPHTSNFNDAITIPPGITSAVSTIQAVYNPSPSVTSDASIQIPSWTLVQNPGALSYAYEQLNFAADFGIYGSTLLGSTPNFPLTIAGYVSTSGNYAQFDAVIDYYYAPSTPGVVYVPAGPVVSLGQLTYSYLQTSGGSFLYAGTSSGTLAPTPTSFGLLEITGEMWVAGDPSSISVSMTAPEPASLGLLALGALALLGRGREESRRRRAPGGVL